MLDYSKLVSLLTAAIQESIKRIQKLESMHKKEMAYSAQKDKDISQLKAENEILKKHYSSLDARLIALEKGTSMNLGARPIKENKEISIFEKIQFRVKKIFQ
jgi:hypothetical protein